MIIRKQSNSPSRILTSEAGIYSDNEETEQEELILQRGVGFNAKSYSFLPEIKGVQRQMTTLIKRDVSQPLFKQLKGGVHNNSDEELNSPDKEANSVRSAYNNAGNKNLIMRKGQSY